MHKKVSVLFVFMLLFSSMMLSAQDLSAVITQISGKVEIKSPSGTWQAAKEGDTVNAGDSISTGFNSKAVLETTDKSSVIVVKQLTRLSLKELLKKQGSVKTDLFLDVGSVRAQVNTSEDLKQDFSVRTASTTASVRGTVLDVETLGDNASRILAWQGVADVVNQQGSHSNVGEDKPAEKKGDDGSTGEQLPPPPPPDLSDLPAISGRAGQMIPGTQVGLSGIRINPGTRPAGPGGIAIRGGGSIGGVNMPIPAGGALPPLPQLPTDFSVPVDVIIQIEWPDGGSLPQLP